MHYCFDSAEAAKAKFDEAFNRYLMYCKGELSDAYYCAPWEAFKSDVMEVVDSKFATKEICAHVIYNLRALTLDHFDGWYNDDLVMFDLGFIYEVLHCIVESSYSIVGDRQFDRDSNRIEIMKMIINLCEELREKGRLVNEYTNQMDLEYHQFVEERVFKAIIDHPLQLDESVVLKMMKLASVNIYEYFVEHDRHPASKLQVYGYIFYSLYEKYSTVWPLMLTIRSRFRRDGGEIFTKMRIAAKMSDNVYEKIVGAMSALWLSQTDSLNLATHDDEVVRFAAAFNSKLDISALEVLARDRSDSVKWRAISTLKEIVKYDRAPYEKRGEKAFEILARLEISGYCKEEKI